jgi:hypothetical protein
MKIKQDGELLFVEFLLSEIGNYLVKIPVTVPVVTKINKMFRDEKECREEPLTDDDFTVLDNLFLANDLDFNLVRYEQCTEPQFEQFKKVFELWENKPDWLMKPYYTDYSLEEIKRREEIIKRHTKSLEMAIEDGLIKIFSMDHFPMTKVERDSRISREDADKYLKQHRLTFAEADAPQQNTEITTKPRKKLKPRVRDTNEGLLLLYEIFDKYDVKYLDDLLGSVAWTPVNHLNI